MSGSSSTSSSSQAGQRRSLWRIRDSRVDAPANRTHRQVHGERRAKTLAPTLGGHRAAVSLGEMPHDRKTQPQSAVSSRGRTVGLPEALEHVLKEIETNALPGIRDHDRRVRIRVPELDVDPARPSA